MVRRVPPDRARSIVVNAAIAVIAAIVENVRAVIARAQGRVCIVTLNAAVSAAPSVVTIAVRIVVANADRAVARHAAARHVADHAVVHHAAVQRKHAAPSAIVRHASAPNQHANGPSAANA